MKKLLLAAFSILAFNISQAQIQAYNVGDVVTDFTVTDVHGVSHNLYTYTAAGKHVFLDFFFTTCGPCQATSPIFNEFYDKYGCNKGDIICLAINTGQDNNAAVIAYENQFGGSYNHAPAVSGDGGSATVDNNFSPAAYPTYCIIGPDNKIKNLDIWPINNVGNFEAAFPSGFNPTPTSCSIGVEEMEITEVAIFPNPNKGYLNILFKGTAKDVSVSILDLTGKLIFEKNFETAETISFQHDLKPGTYIIEINSQNTSTKQRLIVI